jgi:hypothetical protein
MARDTLRRPARTDVAYRTASGATILAAGPAGRREPGPVSALVGTGTQRLATALTAFPLAVVAGIGPGPLAEWAQEARRALRADGRPAAEALAFLLAAPVTLLFLVRGLAYPLVVTDTGDAWGGPGLTGAWAAHVAVGLAMVAAVAVMVGPLVRPKR